MPTAIEEIKARTAGTVCIFILILAAIVILLYTTTIGTAPKVVEPEYPCLWTIDRGKVNCGNEENK